MNIIKSAYFARVFVLTNILAALGVYLTINTGFANDSPKQEAGFLAPRAKNSATDGQVAFLTAATLQQIQFGHKRFDSGLSNQLYEKYFEYWDPQHRFFLQSDLDEFSHYRTLLDDMMLNFVNPDVKPAFEIFERFKKRLGECAQFAAELLDREGFSFTDNDYFETDRKKSPYPKDVAEAHELWKNRLKAEYLEEKLSRTKKKKSGKEEKVTESINEKLKKRYQRNYNLFAKYTDEEVLGAYLAVLSRLYDPHTDFLTASELESFEISMNLALVGVGLELRVDDGFPTITKVLPGGPASRTKLKAGDRIIGVQKEDGSKLDLVEMSIDHVVSHIRGKKGTKVVLTIDPKNPRSDDHYDLTLIRDEIKLEDQEAKAEIIKLPHGEKDFTIGLIDLPSFYSSNLTSNEKNSVPKSSTLDVATLLNKFEKEKVDGVILDLRENGGGSLEEAINLTGLFIKQGPVVQIKDPSGQVKVEEDTDPRQQYDGPLIVLTSKQSASASEILAGALQDYGRALVVGDSSTFGKGTVQGLYPLKSLFRKMPIKTIGEPGGAIKLTTNKFYRPSGESTQNKGVIPDIVLPSVLGASADFGESSLDASLPWDTIKPDEFEKENLVSPYLTQLKRNSSSRVQTDPEFSYIATDIKRLKEREAEKKISLNEEKRVALQNEDEAREKKREEERKARGEPKEVVYKISIRQAAKPGLPAPELADAKKANDTKESLEDEDEEESEKEKFDAARNETLKILVDYVEQANNTTSKELTSVTKPSPTR